MPAPSQAAARKAVSDLVVGVTCCVAAAAVIDWYADPGLADGTRLGLTVGFFAAVLAGCYLLLAPRRRAVAGVVDWMYDEAPPHTLQTARGWAHAADRLITWAVWLVAAVVAATAVRVLALWWPALAPLAGLAGWVWWGGVIALGLLPFAGGSLFQGVFQAVAGLSEQNALTDSYRPRRFAELFDPRAGTAGTPAPLAIGPDLSFTAGGRGWSWSRLHSNCLVFGATGGGKTVCVLNTLLEGLIGSAAAAGHPPGGLILDPVGDYEAKLRAVLRKYGLEHTLRVIDPTRPYQSERWNPLDSPDDELEVAVRSAAAMQAAAGPQQGGGSNDQFFVTQAALFVRHALALLRATQEEPPAPAQILELAGNMAAIADRLDPLEPRTTAARNAALYFGNEWATKAEETRSGVQAFVSNMLDPFTLEPYDWLLAGRSTIRLADALDQGLIVYLRMPVAEKEAMARLVGTLLKLEYYREVLRRPEKARPSLFLCDEFQFFLTTGQGKGDAEFFERSRKCNHVNVVATQNLPGLSRQTPGQKEPAYNLLGNCATKVFLQNAEVETNEYACKLFGKELVRTRGRAAAAGPGRIGLLGVSTSSTDQYDDVVPAKRFAELAVPDKTVPGRDHCEGYIHSRDGEEVGRRKTRWPVHPLG